MHSTSLRMVSIDGIALEAPLEGTLLFFRNRDVPGVIGQVGTILGSQGVNIATFALGRREAMRGAEAIALVQLDGDEIWEEYSDFDLPVIKGVRLGGPVEAAAVAWPPGSILKTDTRESGKLGGTGKTFPWEWAADLGEHYRLVVSGGLAADNVGDVVRQLQPWGVDASSRLETKPGVKDPDKVRAYVSAARRLPPHLTSPAEPPPRGRKAERGPGFAGAPGRGRNR